MSHLSLLFFDLCMNTERMRNVCLLSLSMNPVGYAFIGVFFRSHLTSPINIMKL